MYPMRESWSRRVNSKAKAPNPSLGMYGSLNPKPSSKKLKAYLGQGWLNLVLLYAFG